MSTLRTDAERLARVETDVIWLREIAGRTADDVTEIKIMLAKEEGKRAMVKYMGHAASVIMGGIMGFFGGGIK